MDGRVGVNVGDVYAQHVLASGGIDAAWPTGGTALCTASGLQQHPRILADGSGGAIVTWYDGRVGINRDDIYAQRVQANGQLGGTVVGVSAAADLDFALDPIHPNPSRGGALSIRFSLAHKASVTVELMDLAGRRLAARALGTLGPGRHTSDLAPADRVPAGLYFVRLQAGGQSRSVRAAILE